MRRLALIALLFHLALPAAAEIESPTLRGTPVNPLVPNGGVNEWIVLGPFPNPRIEPTPPDGVDRLGLRNDYLGELGGETQAVLRPWTRVVYVDDTGAPVTVTAGTLKAESGLLDFERLYPNRDLGVAYAFCYLHSPREQTVTFYFGSDDCARVWVNGEPVHDVWCAGRAARPRNDRFSVRLQKGLNPVLVKVEDGFGGWQFILEAFDERRAAEVRALAPREIGAVFTDRVVCDVRLPYLLFLPRDYDADPDRRWPLILFLHGSGEAGDHPASLKAHGPQRLFEDNRYLPFLLLAPQCPRDEGWHTRWALAALGALLADVTRYYRVDPDRVYVTGASMGGVGTWAVAAAYPDSFAAIAPISGWAMPDLVGRLCRIPCWIFHGAQDPIVSADDSRLMEARLKRAGAEVRLTVYPDAGHDAWTVTYDHPELYEWFLAHRRR